MTDPLTDQIFSTGTEEEVGDLYESEEEPPQRNIFQGEDKIPDRHATRNSGEHALSSIWVGAGTLLVQKRIDPPVGRVMQLQAPLAGKKIDELIAHTWIDRVLQPLFAKSEAFEEIAAIAALPLLVGMFERKPEWAQVLMEPMKDALGTTLENVAPLIRKRKTKQRAAARSMADIADAFDIPRGADPIETILSGWIFQDVMEPPLVEDENAE